MSMSQKHVNFLKILFVILIVNGLIWNSDAIVGRPASELTQWIGILSGMLAIGSIFALLPALLQKRPTDKTVAASDDSHLEPKTGKSRFFWIQAANYLPLVILGILAVIFYNPANVPLQTRVLFSIFTFLGAVALLLVISHLTWSKKGGIKGDGTPKP